MYGGDGNDFIWADLDTDTAYGGLGDDTMYSGLSNSVLLYGEGGNDQIATGNGNDFLSGGDGDDILFSGIGDDTLTGGNGSDALGGYFGNDVFTGGAGVDYFNMTYDVRAGEYESITDWSNTDDWLVLPSYLNGAVFFGDYAGGAYAVVTIGTSYWAVYASGATAAGLQAHTFYA
jgi:Ca2+-binding RTX toxin-like protein